MNAEDIRRLLPEQPPRAVRGWMMREGKREMRLPITVYRAETVTVQSIERTMYYNPMEAPGRPVRMAYCNCLECGEDYYTQWINGPFHGIRLVDGEDCSTYPIYPGDDPGGMGAIVEITDDDAFVCPYCGEQTTLTHASSLRGGRQRQVLLGHVDNIGKYTAVIYYLLRCEVTDYCLSYSFIPREAYVIGDHRAIYHYKHTKKNMFHMEVPQPCWRQVRDEGEAEYVIYHDWGSIENKKRGSAICPIIPDLTGTTGEKTAIEKYLLHNYEDLPASYLYTWSKHPQLEVILRSGFVKLIREIIEHKSQFSYDNSQLELFDLSASRPHDIMRMTKPALKRLQSRLDRYSLEVHTLWNEYSAFGTGKLEADTFVDAYYKHGRSGVCAILEMMDGDSKMDFPKIEHYLDRHRLHSSDIGLLMDTRRMAQELHPDEPLAPQYMWPHDLRRTHDEVNVQSVLKRKSASSARLQAGFDSIRQRFGCLEWTDGELCIIIPASNDDLVREAAILRHCVDTYGGRHIEGKSIFFVRHYRRPERSYYTLQMDMTGIPKEIQLHGYGNERHGDCKQFSHSIPKKVREFCDRWRTEVVMPWFKAAVKREEKIA